MSRGKALKSYSRQVGEIIDRLRLASGASSLAALARAINVKPQNVNQAIRLGSVPEAWLYKVAYTSGYRVEWLRTGEEPQKLNEMLVAETQAPYGGVMDDLDEETRAAVKRLIAAMSSGDELIRSHLIGQLRLVEEALAARHPLLVKQDQDRLPST